MYWRSKMARFLGNLLRSFCNPQRIHQMNQCYRQSRQRYKAMFLAVAATGTPPNDIILAIHVIGVCCQRRGWSGLIVSIVYALGSAKPVYCGAVPQMSLLVPTAMKMVTVLAFFLIWAHVCSGLRLRHRRRHSSTVCIILSRLTMGN